MNVLPAEGRTLVILALTQAGEGGSTGVDVREYVHTNEGLELSRNGVYVILDRLEAAGLTQRRSLEGQHGDRRIKLFSLTEKGREAADEVLRIWSERIERYS